MTERLSNYIIIFSGFIAVLGSLGFARFGYSMILPGMKNGLMLNYTQIGLIESGNFSGYLIFAIIGGLLASRYGPRSVITASLTLVGGSMFILFFIDNFPQALILRSLTGLGSGGANVPAMMLPALWLPIRRRGLGAGIIASGSGAGIIVTGFLIPNLNEMFGQEAWRYSWIILGLLTLFFALFCSITIKNQSDSITAGQNNTKSFKVKTVAADPMLWKIGITYFMFGISYIVYFTFFGAYLINEIGLTVQSAGLLWTLLGFFTIISGPIWGYVSDRIGRGYTLALVYFIQSLSFIIFTMRGSLSLYTSPILYGITAVSIPAIVAAYSGDYFEPKLSFSALGFLTLFFGVGQVLGPLTAGYIIDLTHTFKSAFFLASSMAALGGFLSLTILRKY